MATIEERLAALEALLGMSEGETPYVSQYSGPDIDEGIELARSGTVRKTGDTMTGGLNFHPVGVTGYTQMYKNATSGSADYGTLVLDRDSTGKMIGLKLYSAAQKAKIVDGTSEYDLYHAGNKPTAADVGAVAKDGSVGMTGDLTISKAGVAALSLKNENTGRTFQLNAGGDNTAGIYNRKDANNRVGLYLGTETSTVNNLVNVLHSNAGKTNYYSVLHTGNMNSLISSLRIATGTYTGTGNYAGTVTLTCGFKPAFAIIYRSDTVIGATRVPIDTNVSGATTVYGDWSGDFAILVPTAKGIRVAYNNTVTVESGNTYLKFTPSGTELNGAIAYNYIIVGS